jgi:hypothetical protein
MNNHTDTSTNEPVPDRFKIKYKFIHMMKGSSVAICILADIDYIDARFEELKLCYQQIAKKIGQINIVSKAGAYEFDVANSLVSYYRLSAVNLNSKRECLLHKDIPLTESEIKQREEAAIKWEKRMYNEFREKRL